MKTKILTLLLAISASTAIKAGEARLLRFPTTNGTDIIFTYAGDLYKVPATGGQAERLTAGEGYEMFARFSPDGKTVAFTGHYDGNTEIYTIPANGGEPLRLTYTATNSRDDLGDRMGPNNITLGWMPDGSGVIYRNRTGDGFKGQLCIVPKDGGPSQTIPLPEGGFCSYSPNGKRLAYNRVMREFRTWKYYRGGMADDIRIYDEEKKTVENITNNDAQDIIPLWIGHEIYFLSDRDRTMNFFAYNTKTKTTAKITAFKEYDCKFPSTNGQLIVFENGGYIYKLDPATKKTEKITITLASDNIYARSQTLDAARYLRSASISHDGKRLAVTARGEIFDLPAGKGVTKNITRTPGAHERVAALSQDGKHLAYISDATGETEIYLRPLDGGEPHALTKNSDTYIRNLAWSHDSKHILYSDRKNRLILLNIENRHQTLILQDTLGEIHDYRFSPDSKWITYTRPAPNNFSVIYIYNTADKKEYPVTDHWYDSGEPTFSADGKYLIFRSSRDFNPLYGSKEWNHIYTGSYGAYLVLLKKDTPSPFLLSDGETPQQEKKPQTKEKQNTPDTTANIHIDTDGLPDRILRIGDPSATGHYGNFHSDGKKIYYTRNNSTYLYDLEKQKEEIVAEGARMWIEPGGKKAGFFKGTQIYITDIPSGKANLTEPVNLADMKITTHYPSEWQQIFNEAWRAFRDGFYLENMHGVDWKAMKQKYEVLLPHVKNRLDLNYVIGEMIAELNCGHAYITTGEMHRPQRIPTGLLGAQISKDKTGYFRIDKIYPGQTWNQKLRSPLAEPSINVQPGQYIIAIDGIPTNTVKDLYSLLTGKAGINTEITLNNTPDPREARKIIIRPIDNEHPLIHHEWVMQNIEKTDKASGGKIGYIYIPDMSVEGLNEFARYFYPQLDKEGLIIDDRANGGGNVSPMILERLAREPYRMTMRRGSRHNGTIPDALHAGPKVCLINQYSASDGDLFPWGFRELGLGKLIGTRTWGGIVGISGSLPFIDGTDLRVPFFTSYNMQGEWIIENHGVEPDIEIDNDPVSEWNGEDRQLDRAIEEIMKELRNRKPLPRTPAPRVWNK